MSALLDDWPWWLGGIVLGAIAPLFWAVERRLFGISASFRQVVQSSSFGPARAPAMSAEALEAALMAATEEAFGSEAPSGSLRLDPADRAALEVPPRSTHLSLLVGVALGGLVAGVTTARESSSMGELFTSIYGSGWKPLVALALGGVLVGFGARMAGGCTSGHGLCGASRLQKTSLIAVGLFLVLAMATSWLLEALP